MGTFEKLFKKMEVRSRNFLKKVPFLCLRRLKNFSRKVFKNFKSFQTTLWVKAFTRRSTEVNAPARRACTAGNSEVFAAPAARRHHILLAHKSCLRFGSGRRGSEAARAQ